MPQPARSRHRRYEPFLINAALALASALLFVGLFAPLLTVNRLLIFSDTISLASALVALVNEGYPLLFAVLFGFSVLFPLAKLAYLIYAWNRPRYRSDRLDLFLQWLARLGKWSMLDVFVVSVLVVSVKLRLIADVQVRFGLYAFGASVLLTMLVSGRIARHTRTAPVSGEDVAH